MGKIKPCVVESSMVVDDDIHHCHNCRGLGSGRRCCSCRSQTVAFMDNYYSPLNNNRRSLLLVRLLLLVIASAVLIITTAPTMLTLGGGADIDLLDVASSRQHGHDGKSRGLLLLLRGGRSSHNNAPLYYHRRLDDDDDTNDIGQTAVIPPPISTAGGDTTIPLVPEVEGEEKDEGVHFVTNTTVIVGGDTMKNPTVIYDNDNNEIMTPSAAVSSIIITENEIIDKDVSEAEEEADALLAYVGMPTIPLPTYNNNNDNVNNNNNNNIGETTIAEEIQDELSTVEDEISSLVVAKDKVDTQLTNNVNGGSDDNGDDGEVIAENIDNTIEDLEMVEEELIVEALEEGADDTISSSGGSDTASSAAAAASAPAGMMNTDDTVTSTHSTTMVEDGEEDGNGAHLYPTTTTAKTEGGNSTVATGVNNDKDETTDELKEEIDEIEQEIKVVEAIGVDDDTVMMDDNAEINKEEYVEELKEYEEEVTEELLVKEEEEELGSVSSSSSSNNRNSTSMIGSTNDDDDTVQKDTQSGMDKNTAETSSVIPDGAGLGLTPAAEEEEEEEEMSTPSPTVEYVEPSESLEPLKDESNAETYENGEVISELTATKHGNSNTESHEEKEDELSGETFKNTFPDWAEEEEVKKVGGWLTFAAIVLMIYTAYQMSENPDGICASLCRLVITVIGCVIKIMIIPFKYVLGRGSSSGGRYMTTPDYRDPFGSRQMELT